MRALGGALLGLSLAAAIAPPARADSPLPPASVAAAVGVDDRHGAQLPRELPFTDQDGAPIRSGDLLTGERPLLVTLAYYRCPVLCGLVLSGTVEALRAIDLTPGRDFDAVTVSIDPKDTPAQAAQKRGAAMAALGRERPWPFLVGPETSSRALADALGFRYVYDPASDQYAHPAALFVLTPDGRLSRVLTGVDLKPRDLRLALLEAAAGAIEPDGAGVALLPRGRGSIADRILLSCYRFDPASRRYEPYVLGFMRTGGAIIGLSVLGMLAALWRGERRRARRAGGDP